MLISEIQEQLEHIKQGYGDIHILKVETKDGIPSCSFIEEVKVVMSPSEDIEKQFRSCFVALLNKV